jgi:hypothetical protein
MIKKFILLFVATALLSFTTHKYYLSLTDIKYSPKSKSLQIITNVFMDDIELALNTKYNINLQLTTVDELKNSDYYFEQYLKEKLDFKVNGIEKTFNYIGKEYDGDLVFFYLEIENIIEVSSIEIHNTILTKTFKDQQNLVKLKVKDINKSVLLDLKKDKGLLKL